MKKKTIGFWAGVAMSCLVLFAFASCSSNSDSNDPADEVLGQVDDSTTSSEATDDPQSDQASEGPVETDTVTIAGMKFKPGEIIVPKGKKVVFINNDIVTHDVSHFPDKSWTSGPLDPGKSWEKTFDDSTTYFCSIHPTMLGKVDIK